MKSLNTLFLKGLILPSGRSSSLCRILDLWGPTRESIDRCRGEMISGLNRGLSLRVPVSPWGGTNLPIRRGL